MNCLVTRVLIFLATGSYLLTACGGDGWVGVSDGDTEEKQESTDRDGDANYEYKLEGTLVKGLDISAIAFYQGVKISLMAEGRASDDTTVPVVQGRDAMIRIYVKRQLEWEPRKVKLLVDFVSDNADTKLLETELFVDFDSKEKNLKTTFNIDIPGRFVAGNLKYRVSLLELDESRDGGGNPSAATWPRDGMASLDVQDPGGSLKLVLIPIRYNADKSGRLPNLSDAQIQRFLDGFYAKYPIPEIEITVDDPLDWDKSIGSAGAGWAQLLTKIQNLRNKRGAKNKEYYFALVSPAKSLLRYCGMGCVTGLSNLVTQTRDVMLRAGVGIGFDGVEAANTIVHELGHAHGRNHSPCGLNGQPSDSRYPYKGGAIGTWGYDIINRTLKNPKVQKDIMGYCTPYWTSDYTYKAIFNRIKAVNALPRLYYPSEFQTRWSSLSIDLDGSVNLGPNLTVDTVPQGEQMAVELLDALENVVDVVTGYFYPYSHIPGGLVLFPEPDVEVISARLVGSDLVPL